MKKVYFVVLLVVTNVCYAASDSSSYFQEFFYINDITKLSLTCLPIDANNFLFKVCKVANDESELDSCETLSEDKKLGKDLQTGYFYSSINELVNMVAPEVDTTTSNYKDQLMKLHSTFLKSISTQPSKEDKNLEKLIAKLSEEINKTKDQKSVALTITLKDKIYYYRLSKEYKCILKENNYRCCKKRAKLLCMKNKIERCEDVMDITNVQLAFESTTLDQIDIEWTKNGIQQPTISNPDYSINIRSLMDGNESIEFHDREGEQYILYYSDVFIVSPVNEEDHKSTINYYPKNGSYNLKPTANKVNVLGRGFSDYFYANVFLDPFGVSDNNPNKFIQTDFNLEIPIVYRNKNFLSFCNYLQIRATLGADFGNFNGNDKYLQTFPDTINRINAGYQTYDTLPINIDRYVIRAC